MSTHTVSPVPHTVRVLSARQLVERLGLSQATFWRMRRRGQLPEPIRLSPGRVGWLESDILQWLAARREATQ